MIRRFLAATLLAAVSWACPTSNSLAASSGRSPSGEYRKTHGISVDSLLAPYVEDYARTNGIDIAAITKILFPTPARPGQQPFVISSSSFISGDWTYFSSVNTQVYELLQTGPCFLVLTRPGPPSATGPWTLSLITPHYKLASQATFRLPLTQPELADSITTNLSVQANAVQLSIDYAHAGGGDPHDQPFRVTVPYRKRFSTPVITKPRSP